MFDAAMRYDTTEMESVMAELDMYEYDTGGDMVKLIRNLLEHLEYDAIQEHLERWVRKSVTENS
jgi:hypothetical protein